MSSFYYNNLLRSATVVSEDTVTNFEFANAIDGRTSSQVGMANGANRDIVLDFTSAVTVNTVCVAAHNLNGTTLTVAGSSDNVSYTTIGTIVYDNNNVRCDSITESTYRYIRLRFGGHTTTIYIADIFLGVPLDLLYGMPQGFTPPEQADRDEIETAMTGNGAIVGITVNARPKRIRIPLQDYPASWFTTNWVALINSLKAYPAYFLWKSDGRAMFFTLYRGAPDPAYGSNTRQSAIMTVEGFVE